MSIIVIKGWVLFGEMILSFGWIFFFLNKKVFYLVKKIFLNLLFASCFGFVKIQCANIMRIWLKNTLPIIQFRSWNSNLKFGIYTL